MKNIVFLFSSNKYDATIPEEAYKKEYKYVVANNYETILLNIEKLKQKGKIMIPKSKTKKWIIYRGGELKKSEYLDLYQSLAEANYIMINTPEEYSNITFISNWYEKISDITPQVYFTDLELDKGEIIYYLSLFPKSIIIKDYVKSRKFEWKEACYIEDVNNTRKAMEVINNFITREGENLIGGLVMREFVELKQLGIDEKTDKPISEEYRIFIYNKQVITAIDYAKGKEVKDTTAFDSVIDTCISRLDASFYTVDIAKTKEGKYIVIEVGDGQSSSLKGLNEEIFYNYFLNLIK